MQFPFFQRMFGEMFSAGGVEKRIFFLPRTAHGTQQHQKDGGGKFVFDNFRADSLSGCIEQQVVRCRSLVVLLLFLPFGSERAADY